MARRRVQADCKADTRGGRWAGIPVCVIESAAYRHCSVHAKAILVELVSRMNGYNNGKIALSQRQLTEALKCSPRKVVRCLAELMEHGLIDVHAEGKWKERLAREYRLTFVTTKGRLATNNYLRWRPSPKSGATASVSTMAKSGSVLEPSIVRPASAVVAVLPLEASKTPDSENPPTSAEVALIFKPYEGSVSWWTVDGYLRASRAFLSLLGGESLRAAA